MAPLTVQTVYDRYHLNLGLRQHMFRVTSLMALILKAWRGPDLDKALLLETMLLHDLANLVKYDLKNPTKQKLLTPTELAFYVTLQANWHARYGTNVDEVTCQLIAELPLVRGPQIIELISRHNPTFLATTVAGSGNWTEKLFCYADGRVAPSGLVTITQRFTDLVDRYQHQPAWNDPTKNQAELQRFLTLETQLQTQVSCDLAAFTNADLEPLDRWSTYEFATSDILNQV